MVSEKRHLIPRTYRGDLKKAVRGEGIYFYDQDGKEYIDGCCGALLFSIGMVTRK